MNDEELIKFIWDIHHVCNYRCPYCWFFGKWQLDKGKSLNLSVEEWKECWDKVYDKYGSVDICITGGEPTLYPSFFKLVKRLSENHFLSFMSNLSFDVKDFLQAQIPNDKLDIGLSFHPHFDNVEHFLDKVVSLKEEGYSCSVNFVLYPPQMYMIRSLKEKFRENGFSFFIQPYCGEYKDKEYYTESFKEDQRKFLKSTINYEDLIDYRVRKKRVRGKLCWAGIKSATVSIDGKVFRCNPMIDRYELGEIKDANFKLLDNAEPCENDFCKLDESVNLTEIQKKKRSLKEEAIDEIDYNKDENKAVIRKEDKEVSNLDEIKDLIERSEWYLHELNDLNGAERLIKEALRRENDNIWALRVLAKIYREKAESVESEDEKDKYLDLAFKEIEKALHIDDKEPWVNAEASCTLLAQSELTEAAKRIEIALDKEPDNNFFCYIKKKIGDKKKVENIQVSEINRDIKVAFLGGREYSEKKIILESSPKQIFIQASGPCNSYCVFCSRGKNYKFFNLSDFIRNFKTKLFPYIQKAEQLTLTGQGEFLQLPEAEKILNYFDLKFPYTRKMFSTNGFSLTPSICEKLVGSNSEYIIHISLHASNARLHKVITRTDTFDIIINQLKHLLKLRKKRAGFNIYLYFVATVLNIEDLPNFIRLAYNLGVDKIICCYNYIYIPAQKYLSCFFKKDLANKVLEEARKMADGMNFSVELPPGFDKKYKSVSVCKEAWTQLMVNSKGDVLPCDASGGCNENLLEKDFWDVWNGEYYQNLRRELISNSATCFKNCFRVNPSAINNLDSHIIHRGRGNLEDVNLWGENF